jgi:hypothetical protein
MPETLPETLFQNLSRHEEVFFKCARKQPTFITFIFAEDLDGGEYLFAFRMLMVLFRREFSFADTLYLWEVRTNSHDKTNFITFD